MTEYLAYKYENGDAISYVIDFHDIFARTKIEVPELLKILLDGKYFHIFLIDSSKNGKVFFGYTETNDHSDQITISEDWVDMCFNNLIRELALNEAKKKILIEKPTSKSVSEINNEAVEHITKKEYHEAIDILKKGLMFTFSKHYKITVYNLSCAYSCLQDEDNTFKYLSLAFESGFKDWETLINDDDFTPYKNHPQFLSLVELMKL